MPVFDQLTQIQISLKKLVGKSLSGTNLGTDNEVYGSAVTNSASTTFAEAPPFDPLKATATTDGTAGDCTNSDGTQNNSNGGVVEYVDLELEEIPGTDGKGFAAKLPVNYQGSTAFAKGASGISPFTDGQLLATSSGLLQCVPQVYGDSIDKYQARLFWNDAGTLKEIFEADPRRWYFDYFSGVLFQEDAPAEVPAIIRVHIWIGDMVDTRIGLNTQTSDGIVLAGENGSDGDVWTSHGNSGDPEWIALPLNSNAGTTGMVNSAEGVTGGWVWTASGGGTGGWLEAQGGGGEDTDWWEGGSGLANFNTHLITTSSVAIGVGSTGVNAWDQGHDTFFYVGGTYGSRAEHLEGVFAGSSGPGTSVFGGDLVTSGTLTAGQADMVLLAPTTTEDPFTTHTLMGTHIDIGGIDGDGADGAAAVRLIGNLGTQLEFTQGGNSISLLAKDTLSLGASGAHIHAYAGNTTGGGDVELVPGDNHDATPPPFNGALSGVKGGNTVITSGDGIWESGDINLLAGGSAGKWTLEEATSTDQEGGAYGGDVLILAGEAAYAGNVAISGGHCNAYEAQNDPGFYFNGEAIQKRTGDVYVDGGSTELVPEGPFGTSNILLNVSADPGNPQFGPDGETWCNTSFATWATTLIDNTGAEVKFKANQKATRAITMDAINGNFSSPPYNFNPYNARTLNRKLTACEYREKSSILPGATGVQQSYIGPFKITYQYVPGSYPNVTGWSNPPPDDLPWLIEWGPTTAQNNPITGAYLWELRITKYDTGHGGTVNPTYGHTVEGLANALFPPEQMVNWIGTNPNAVPTGDLRWQPGVISGNSVYTPWRLHADGVPTLFPVQDPYLFTLTIPISLEYEPGEGINQTSSPTSPISTGEDGMVLPSDDWTLTNTSARGVGIGEPWPTATVHITDNGKFMQERGLDVPGVLDPAVSSPIVVGGLNDFPLGQLLLTWPDMWGTHDTDYFQPDSNIPDVVYKLPILTSVGIIALGAAVGQRLGSADTNDDPDDNPKEKSPAPNYTHTITLDTNLVDAGHIRDARYELDEPFRYVEALCPDGSYPPCDETPIDFDPRVDVWGKAEFDHNIMIDTFDFAIKNQTDANEGILDIILPSGIHSFEQSIANKTVNYPALGRIVKMKDMTGGAGAKEGMLIRVNAVEGETIDGMTQVVINKPYAALTLVANGKLGWSIDG